MIETKKFIFPGFQLNKLFHCFAFLFIFLGFSGKFIAAQNNSDLNELLRTAQIRISQGYSDEAVNIYMQIIENHGDTFQAAQACLHVSEIMMNTGEPARAVHVLRILLNSPHAKRYEALARQRTGECYFAMNAFGQALEILKDPESKIFYDPAVYVLRSRIYEAAGQFDLALEEAQKGVEKIKGEVTWTRLINLYLKKKDLEKYLEELEKEFVKSLGNMDLHEKLVRIYMALKKPQKAAQVMEQLKQFKQGNTLDHLFYARLAKIYMSLKKWEKALENLNSALGQFSNNSTFRILSAQCWFELGNQEKASKILMESIKDSPRQEDYSSAAGEFFSRRIFDKAQDVYLMARKRFNSSNLFLDELLMISSAEENFEKAFTWLKKAVHPVHMGRVNIYTLKTSLENCFKDDEKALKGLEKAAGKMLNDSDPVSYLVAAQIFRLNKKYDIAQEYLIRYGMIAKDMGQQLFRLALDLYSDNNLSASARVFKGLMDSFGTASGFFKESMNKYLAIMIKTNDISAAAKAQDYLNAYFGPVNRENSFSKEFFADPSNLEIKLRRADVYIMLGKYEKALILADSLPKAMSYVPETQKVLIRARCLAGAGLFEEAVIVLSALVLPPERAPQEFKELLGQVFLLKAECQTALSAFESALESLNILLNKLSSTISSSRGLAYYRLLKKNRGTDNKRYFMDEKGRFANELIVISKSLEAYLTAGKENFESLLQTPDFKSLLKDPSSLAGPVVYEQYAQTLLIYHNKKKAAQLYEEIAGLWPENSSAPMALFTAANLLIELESDKKNALAILEKLIAQYPQSGCMAPARRVYFSISK
jgi:tetratricopeptide (TPR) repeat protein